MVRKSVRERLLDAADAVMFVDGAVATPVDRILREAGASPASLYTQFGSKDGLVVAALWRRLEVWTGVWDQALAEATTDVDRLLSVFPALRTYHDEHLAERWCAFSGTAASSSRPSPEVAEVLQRENDLLTGRLLELAYPVAGETGAKELADQVMVAYCGTLALMLRRPAHEAIDLGERIARAAAVGPCEHDGHAPALR